MKLFCDQWYSNTSTKADMILDFIIILSMRCISCCLFLQSETKLYNGSDKDVSASGNKLTKKESLKVTEQ